MLRFPPVRPQRRGKPPPYRPEPPIMRRRGGLWPPAGSAELHRSATGGRKGRPYEKF